MNYKPEELINSVLFLKEKKSNTLNRYILVKKKAWTSLNIDNVELNWGNIYRTTDTDESKEL
jgi:hypothetical protein